MYDMHGAGTCDGSGGGFKIPKFAVIGHRGNGMNMLNSSDSRMKHDKENSLLSFNTAATYPLDFVEFDVQVFFCCFSYVIFDFFSRMLIRCSERNK